VRRPRSGSRVARHPHVRPCHMGHPPRARVAGTHRASEHPEARDREETARGPLPTTRLLCPRRSRQELPRMPPHPHDSARCMRGDSAPARVQGTERAPPR